MSPVPTLHPPVLAFNPSTIARRLAYRDQSRTEADIQSDVRALPLTSDPNGRRWLAVGRTRLPCDDTARHVIRRDGDAPSTDPVIVLVADDVEGTVRTLGDWCADPRGAGRATDPERRAAPAV